MDQETTVLQLKNSISEFLDERGWNPPARDLAISISLEASELLEHYQWSGYEDHDKRNISEIKKELADIIIYCLEFSLKNNIDISKAISEKLEHNAKKYPVSLFNKKQDNEDDYYRVKKSYRTSQSVD